MTFSYNYDNINRVTSVSKNGTTEATYTYNDYGELTGETHGNTSYSYSYWYTGNLEMITKTVDGVTTSTDLKYDGGAWRDRLIAVGDKTIEYDPEAPGLPVKYYNGKSYSFAWSEQGDLVTSVSSSKIATYGYYYGGLRAYKTSGGVRHTYYYDGDRLIAESFGTKYLLFHYDENDSINSITYYNGTSSYTYQLLKNLQGDVVAILNYNNSIIATYEYDAWGNIISIKNEYGNDITNSTGYFANINPIRYRGYYYDTETGFYYLKSRYYDPANARFISADSLLSIDPASGGLNLFAYCGNDPVNRVDPSGDLPKFLQSFLDEFNEWVETPRGLLRYVKEFNSKGKLYEYWISKDGRVQWSRHHTDHGNPKRHPLVPHDHDWYDDDDGNNTQGKEGLPPNINFHAPDSNSNTDKSENNNISEIVGGTIGAIGVGYGIYVGAKWIIALCATPITGGGSLVIAGVTP